MKMHTAPAARQRGFSILTGFILAIVMFGSLAFFLAGQGISTTFGSTYTNTSKVASLLTSAGYINTGFAAVTLSGTNPSLVTFDSTLTTGIFNPNSGGAAQQPLDPALFIDTTLPSAGLHGYWIYRKNDVKLQGIGDPVGTPAEYTMMASGLKESMCIRINNMLHGDTLTSTFTATALTYSEATLVGVAPVTNSTITGVAVDLTAQGTSGRMNGCYKTSDGVYVYIHTLLAQ